MRYERGFTLLEILVALVLIGLLAGVLVPTVTNQLSRGEAGRVAEDLGGIEAATKAFRVDVQRWPLHVRHLAVQPTAAAPDSVFGGGLYPANLISRWRGPYLEKGSIPGDTLPTAAGGVILGRFLPITWGATSFISVRTKGITQANARAVRLILDGDTAVGNTSSSASTIGRVRWLTGDTMIYLISPVQ